VIEVELFQGTYELFKELKMNELVCEEMDLESLGNHEMMEMMKSKTDDFNVKLSKDGNVTILIILEELRGKHSFL